MAIKTIRKPFYWFYGIAVFIAAIVGPFRASMMPTADPGTHPLQHLWDWFAERELYINLKNIFLFALDGNDWAWFIFLFAGAPTIAAVVTCAAFGGLAGVRSLVARFKPWLETDCRHSAVRTYILLVFAYALGVAVYLGASQVNADQAQLDSVYAALGDGIFLALIIIVFGLILDEGATLEELGWRGFAMPLLQERFSPLFAAIVLGVLWYAWHFPREIANLADNFDSLSYWLMQLQFLVYVVFQSIVIAYFVNTTGGSVLPAIMIHGGSNFWAKALGPGLQLPVPIDPRLLLFVAATILILTLKGPQLGLTPGRKISSPV